MAAVAIVAGVVSLLTMLGYIGRPKMTDLQLRAEEGNPQAQFKLGLCYLNGEGMIKNYVAAYKWVFLSGTSGPARPGNACKYIANKMTTKQFDTAKAQAEKWQEASKNSHLAMN
jgi:hypothetical protein